VPSGGRPHDLKGWYRGELLRHNDAIDRTWVQLREKAKTFGREVQTRLLGPLEYPAVDAAKQMSCRTHGERLTVTARRYADPEFLASLGLSVIQSLEVVRVENHDNFRVAAIASEEIPALSRVV
jgi:hypothetical protein